MTCRTERTDGETQYVAIAAAIQRQKTIAAYYANIDLQQLEADAIGKLQAKEDFTSDFIEDHRSNEQKTV